MEITSLESKFEALENRIKLLETNVKPKEELVKTMSESRKIIAEAIDIEENVSIRKKSVIESRKLNNSLLLLSKILVLKGLMTATTTNLGSEIGKPLYDYDELIDFKRKMLELINKL